MAPSREIQILADSNRVQSAIQSVAETIRSCIRHPERVALIGIHTHGVPLARRIKAFLDSALNIDCPLGTVDITLYRDDYDLRGVKPRIQSSEIRFSIDQREIILVDDVLFTGRTIRAAIESLGDYGRPNAIRLAVLVDRGHRELPIQPDAVGLTLTTTKADRIRVHMTEIDGNDEVLLIQGGA
jgi:pyrimidine operon attenuation protein/uracil phosphoribosyltransferase